MTRLYLSSCSLATLNLGRQGQAPSSSSLRIKLGNSLLPASVSFPLTSVSTNPVLSSTVPLLWLRPSTSPPNVSTRAEPEIESVSSGKQVEEFCKERLLASNVPWSCTPEDIRSLFEKFGTVINVELSMHNKIRNRGLAFVTMGSPEEALAALQGLELSEFEGRTLKLNYAKMRKKRPSSSPSRIPGLSFNLFVSNLSFEARANDLKEFFISEDAEPLSAEIIFHDNPRRSTGYGFVSFKTKKQAEIALKTSQGKMFMGRSLRVARSRHFARMPKEGLGPQSDESVTASAPVPSQSNDAK